MTARPLSRTISLALFCLAPALLSGGCGWARILSGPRPDPRRLDRCEQHVLHARGAFGRRAGRWWEAFQDPVLNRLIQRGAAQNLSVQLAVQRVRQARAVLGESEAGLWPSLDASSSFQRTTTRLPKPSGAAATSGGGTGVRPQFEQIFLSRRFRQCLGTRPVRRDAPRRRGFARRLGGQPVRPAQRARLAGGRDRLRLHHPEDPSGAASHHPRKPRHSEEIARHHDQAPRGRLRQRSRREQRPGDRRQHERPDPQPRISDPPDDLSAQPAARRGARRAGRGTVAPTVDAAASARPAAGHARHASGAAPRRPFGRGVAPRGHRAHRRRRRRSFPEPHAGCQRQRFGQPARRLEPQRDHHLCLRPVAELEHIQRGLLWNRVRANRAPRPTRPSRSTGRRS